MKSLRDIIIYKAIKRTCELSEYIFKIMWISIWANVIEKGEM